MNPLSHQNPGDLNARCKLTRDMTNIPYIVMDIHGYWISARYRLPSIQSKNAYPYPIQSYPISDLSNRSPKAYSDYVLNLRQTISQGDPRYTKGKLTCRPLNLPLSFNSASPLDVRALLRKCS